MRRSHLVWTVLLTAFLSVLAGTELVMKDGSALEGTDVRRDGDVYVLTQEGGGTIVVPQALVDGVRLSGTGESSRRSEHGTTEGAKARTLAGPSIPDGPTGIREMRPETLAGAPVRPPRRSEQLEVFGTPARFQEDIVKNDWAPSSDWDMDPEKNNNFAPSTWAEGSIDPNWTPKSAWDADEDVLASGRSTWQGNIIDPSWTPTDGFR